VNKLFLGWVCGGAYIWCLWSFQSSLGSPVPLVVLPLWIWLALRAAGFWLLLVFLSFYAPSWRLQLVAWVRQVIESEDWDV